MLGSTHEFELGSMVPSYFLQIMSSYILNNFSITILIDWTWQGGCWNIQKEQMSHIWAIHKEFNNKHSNTYIREIHEDGIYNVNVFLNCLSGIKNLAELRV